MLILRADAGRWSSQKNSGGISGGTLSEKYSSSIKVGVVSRATTDTIKTNASDVEGLTYLCNQFPSLEEDNPDPCSPPVWSWIQCNSDPQPRIIALNLGNSLLLGTIPDFSMMDALESIDFQQNYLSGTIPSFLGDFPHLQELNLAYNVLLSGLIPDSIACNKNLKLSLDGIYNLYTSNSCPSGTNSAVTAMITPPQTDASGDGYVYTTTTYRKKSKTPVIVGSIVSLSGVVAIAVGIFAIFRHKSNAAAAVAAANAQGPGDEQSTPKFNIPTEERPMTTRPTNLSP